MKKSMSKMLVAAALLAGASAAAGPTVAQQSAQPLKFGFINKMGDHPWFVAEVQGAKDEAAKLGAQLLVQDVQFNADLTVTAFDTMLGDGVKGIAIVVPDRGLGPVIAEKAKKAGIALVAVDDDIYTNAKEMVPYVGMNAYNIGRSVGEKLAELYKAEKWAGREVRLASIEDRKADTCMQRNKGAEETFLKAVPDFDKSKIVRVAYDNTMVNSIDVMTTTLTAHPQVTHWVFYSCNDDGVLGAARALENAGYKPEQGLGIGIDGSRACDALGSGKPSGFRGTMWLNSANHGATAIRLLHAAVTKKEPLPTTTYTDPEFISQANFAGYRGKLCKQS